MLLARKSFGHLGSASFEDLNIESLSSFFHIVYPVFLWTKMDGPLDSIYSGIYTAFIYFSGKQPDSL